jgi:hypothetical protein
MLTARITGLNPRSYTLKQKIACLHEGSVTGTDSIKHAKTAGRVSMVRKTVHDTVYVVSFTRHVGVEFHKTAGYVSSSGQRRSTLTTAHE